MPWAVWAAIAVLVAAGWLAYRNSFGGPLIFDDVPGILENPTVQKWWPPWDALRPPPQGQTVTGRPLVNLSLAFNFPRAGAGALAQDPAAVRPYHEFNLAVHVLAALALFGVVRRTLLRPALRARFGGDAVPVALAAALLWLLHPLQTESVTYIIQRAEAMMGLFYLTTLYCFIRGLEAQEGRTQPAAEPPPPSVPPGQPALPPLISSATLWFALAVVACLLGVASKEVIVSAPVLVLLYDRTFGAGSFREAWRRRRGAFTALFATWLPLGLQTYYAGTRGASAGFGAGVAPLEYAATQAGAITHYLRLTFWPEPLVLDYGQELWQYPSSGGAILLVTALVVGTGWALGRRPVLGFFGCWFLAALAPSSSFVPVVTQTWAEHRMYLALGAPVVLFAVAVYAALGRRGLAALAVLAVALGVLTARRNDDYASGVTIWADAAAKRPLNARAFNNLAIALAGAGRNSEAVPAYFEAVRLRPFYPDAHTNLGNALVELGRYPEAIRHHREAIRQLPTLSAAYYNLGNIYAMHLRQPAEARALYETALRLQPKSPAAHNNLGNVLLSLGESAAAIEHYQAAIQLVPGYPEPNFSVGTYLVSQGRAQEALPYFETALRGRPNHAEGRNNYGGALLTLRRVPEAIAQFELALRLQPAMPGARSNLDYARAMLADPRIAPPTVGGAPPPPGGL